MSREVDPITAETIHAHVLSAEGLDLPIFLKAMGEGQLSTRLADPAP
jgi:hypothetical protein